jgi:hypothetical protein
MARWRTVSMTDRIPASCGQPRPEAHCATNQRESAGIPVFVNQETSWMTILHPTAHGQIIDADLLRPQPDFDRRSDTTPSMGIRGGWHLRRSAAQQMELYHMVAMIARYQRHLGTSATRG